ncbi:hypothetical protein HEQ60_03955 [Haematospirillum sp. H1815]|uniref:DUF6538 domain-containing protein n=1 Tax=Haematospirillum sp. H1815 TaxID=2723108 RepID=UPI00143A101F|nr:DUF6538 domain-containing protein [Haematospirillum sp. H1815]NKD76916.1 hypothetical protein [Haematospirillum sp. H1815]
MTSRYILQQGRTLYFRRRAPIDLAPQLGRFVKIALGTDSFDVARRLVGHINTNTDQFIRLFDPQNTTRGHSLFS